MQQYLMKNHFYSNISGNIFYVLKGSEKKKKVWCSALVKFQFAAKLPYQAQAT